MSNKGGPPYTYTQLSGLFKALHSHPTTHSNPNSRASAITLNVWGTIAEVSAPRPTKGTDHVQNVYLLDPSLAWEEGQLLTQEQEMLKGGAQVLFFTHDPSLFLQAAPGDIVRFHRIELTEFNGKPQLMARIGKDPNGKPRSCQYCLFDKAVGAPLEPRQKSSPNYTMTQADRENLQLLREYNQDHGGAQVVPNKYLSSIHDLEPNTFADIVCRVVGSEDRASRHEVFYVWDGTDARPYDISMDRRRGMAEAGTYSEGDPGHIDDAILCRRLPPYTGGRPGDGVVPDFPELGSAVPVNLYKPLEHAAPKITAQFRHLQNQAVALPELPPLGSWVKLKNVNAIVVEGQLQLLYTDKSQWTPWQEMPAAMRQKYERRFENDGGSPEWGPVDSGEVVAWPCEEEDGCINEVTTLREILMSADLKVRKRFKCFVRLVDYLPKDPARFCRSHRAITQQSWHRLELDKGWSWTKGQADDFIRFKYWQNLDAVKRCIAAKGPKISLDRGAVLHERCVWQFCVSMHLEDATGELDATLVGKHGSEFFRGCPEMDLSSFPEYQGALERTMLACMSLSKREGGEWMGCIVERIHPDPSASQENVKAKYRLVSTVLEPRIDELVE